MEKIWKRSSELVVFRHNFKRSSPGTGWLADGESLADPISVSVYDSDGAVQAAMLVESGIDPEDTTRVKYTLTGGVRGETYSIVFLVNTTLGQTFEDEIVLRVLE